MRPLSARDIIRAWESGRGLHPVDVALTLLAYACPGMTREELASLSVGQRNAHLLTLRELTFGPTLNSYAECPHCAERLEFAVKAGDVRAGQQHGEGERTLELVDKVIVIQFRLPNSMDLAAIANCDDAPEAREMLVQRCVVQADMEGVPTSAEELPDEVSAKLASRIVESDPQAEVLLDIECPSCGHRWQTVLDIASYFWAEICAQAKRLLREVQSLARAYGWAEADILSMSRIRRQLYMEMLP